MIFPLDEPIHQLQANTQSQHCHNVWEVACFIVSCSRQQMQIWQSKILENIKFIYEWKMPQWLEISSQRVANQDSEEECY